jgi:hypothetical protein
MPGNGKNNIVKQLQEVVARDFSKDISTSLVPSKNFEKLEEFRDYLIDKVSELLDKNFDLLVNTLYRIDVSEQKLSELFSSSNRENIPEKLADLIIERQFQKIYFRQKYKEGNL